MRIALPVMLCVVSLAAAQTPGVKTSEEAKLATLKFLGSLYDAESGGYRNEPMAKPSLRATNAAVKATKYLGGKLDDKEKTAKFILSCYDEKTGAFAEPGGKPDVTTTCIGVMAAMELGTAKEKIAKAPDYITENAKVFEEVRIGAAAFEAWSDAKGWKNWDKTESAWWQICMRRDNQIGAREEAATLVTGFRLSRVPLDKALKDPQVNITNYDNQLDDGGWGKFDAKSSDIESVYRVMRAFMIGKRLPGNPAKLREFIAKHRNDDGGSATKPGEKSSATGTYYAVIITKWLDELSK
jgi:hypothetical protein